MRGAIVSKAAAVFIKGFVLPSLAFITVGLWTTQFSIVGKLSLTALLMILALILSYEVDGDATP